jgi:KDO2-lipid IV(A) lauroyltransferase
MPAGPALLALRTGAPLFTVSLWYDGEQPRGRVLGPVPPPPESLGSLDVRVRAFTQTIADRLADGIAAHPADWHMLQRLWLAPSDAWKESLQAENGQQGLLAGTNNEPAPG